MQVTFHWAPRVFLGALLLLAWLVATVPADAQQQGCRTELRVQTGAQVVAQPLVAGSDGERVPVGPPVTEIEARSGQMYRLLVRPLEGSARPSGPDCLVRLNVSRLTPFARLLNRGGFAFDGSRAYAAFQVGEERTIDFEIKPFSEWNSTAMKTELETLTIRRPETGEFVARLPAPTQPSPGTVCADVVYPDAESASGVVLGLSAPTDAPPDRRAAGPDGRVCWDGFDELLYGELSLQEPADAALGQPKSRYVSYEASYRLFVVKRPS